MVKVNENYANLAQNYLFAEIARRVSAYKAANPDKKVISMGIGDVTRPLCKAVTDAMSAAVAEMADAATFQGYPPAVGYDFLINEIENYYTSRNIPVKAEDIFVSDGAKSDTGNITDIFSNDNSVLIPDPVYPVYMDSNVMLGRSISLIDATEENGYLPLPDDSTKGDIIYICSPNNPTGATYTRDQLKIWVDFALKNGSVILFDAAYEAFVSDPELPRSIYEIPGARGCAIEFCSFSKTAGFTGTRCGYTIVPSELEFGGVKLAKLWTRRQSTKYNGTAYIIQRGAAAVFSPEGYAQTRENINYYRENARLIMDFMDKKGISYTGGQNSPYIWLKCPDGLGSWELFDKLLNSAAVVGTPGAGFGKNGEGRFRLTSFGSREGTVEALGRLDLIF
ncbi:MAG: LL-diaminopimelate aminotransferase [Ruminococcaceae bacterium]|nr:LL-diaminopimelate aminotransferase [Oscillospiraceae bacterium]